MRNPSSVQVLGETEIRRVPPSSVAQILAGVPGVRVSESGIERIKIRGESSERVSIMIDGQAITDHTNYGTPILIAPDSIERIEVVRGPSSVASGNRAIGGVVNIVTKRGADKPVEITASAGYLSANEGYRTSLSAAGTVGDFDYRLTWSQSELGDRRTPEGTLTPSGRADRDLSGHVGYRIGNHYFGAKVQDYDLSADVYTGDPNFTIDLPKRDLRKYGVFYEGTDLTPWLTDFKVNLFSQTIDREYRSDITFPTGPFMMNVLSTSDDMQTTSGLNIRANMDFAPGHRTVVGLELEDDQLEAYKTSTVSMIPPFGPPTESSSYSDASIQTLSVFAQHEAELTSRTTATFGARYYHVQSSLDRYEIDGVAQPGEKNSDDRLLGSAGLVHELTDNTILRASISQGYTYPSLSQLYLTSSGGGGTTIGNPDLKPEQATNYEIGARINTGAVVFDGTLFYTDSRDYIASIATGNPNEYQYENVNSAKSYGAEIGAEFDPAGWGVRPYVTAAAIRREFRYENGYATADSGSPGFMGTFGVRGDWTAGRVEGTWDVFLRGESAARQRDDTGAIVDQSDAYATLNLRASAMLTDNLRINFEAANLTNESYRPINQIQAAGRSFSLFVTGTF
nr:TonB-dependent receptor [Shimia biformata]